MGPIKVAVLARDKGKFVAKVLDEEGGALEEHLNMVEAAAAHMAKFRAVVEGEAIEGLEETPPIPAPPEGTA